jgi:16S rRNA (cytosine967-C5)-methyltransferase
VSSPGLPARRVAFEAIRGVHRDRVWATEAVDAALEAESAAAPLEPRDRSFAASLAYETLRWKGTLDWALARVTSRPLAQVEPAVRDLMRLGAWQILFAGVPERAAVATTVELTKAVASGRASGFVNGVLRGLTRARGELAWPDQSSDRGLALATGYPEWVAAEARARFAEQAGSVLSAGNAAPGTTLRAVGDRDALMAELTAGGVPNVALGSLAPEAVHAPSADPRRLAAVAQGRAVVQDEASMLVARVTASRQASGWRALDACAGPGGKATHLGALGAWVLAAEVVPPRADMVAEAAGRMGAAVHPVVADATAPAWRAAELDAVLVDAPCTDLGTTRRRPELRWRRTSEDPDRLHRRQLQLLASAAEALRPGGRLVYSVCTWTVAETSRVAEAFLEAHGSEFTAEPCLDELCLDERSPPRPRSEQTGDPGLQLRPDTDGCDGMYILRLRRR